MDISKSLSHCPLGVTPVGCSFVPLSYYVTCQLTLDEMGYSFPHRVTN